MINLKDAKAPLVLSSLGCTKVHLRLTFFYPEQQYLTVRYAFGRTLKPEHIPEIIEEFLEFIRPHFDIFYAKISRFSPGTRIRN